MTTATLHTITPQYFLFPFPALFFSPLNNQSDIVCILLAYHVIDRLSH